KLSGKDLAQAIRAQRAAEVEAGPQPRLAVVVATGDEASLWYVRSIAKAAAGVGIAADIVDLGPDARPEQIRENLIRLSGDSGVHGLMLQTPLPPGASAQELAGATDPRQDVDGANPPPLGRPAAGLPALPPPPPAPAIAPPHHPQGGPKGRPAGGGGRGHGAGQPPAPPLP